MQPSLGHIADRARYLPALVGSGLTFLGAAAALGASTPGHFVAGAIAGVLPGVGAALLNEFHKSFHDSSNEQRARRNHLIRCGMAESLRDALLRAETAFADEIPLDCRESFFRYWPEVLLRAQKDADLIDVLFPLEQSEDQWNLLNRYYKDLESINQSPTPSDQKARLRQREAQDQETLASLLRKLPLRESDDKFPHLFSETLTDRWPKDASLTFAAKLLPLYRISFAAVFSAGGPISQAIEYKNQTFTRLQLETIQFQLQNGIDSLGKQITGVSSQVSQLESKFDVKLDNLDQKSDALPRIEDSFSRVEEKVGEVGRGVEQLYLRIDDLAEHRLTLRGSSGRTREALQTMDAVLEARKARLVEEIAFVESMLALCRGTGPGEGAEWKM